MRLRKQIIAANWKMNMTSSEVKSYLETLLFEINAVENVDVVLFPSFTSLPKASELLTLTSMIQLGAQNMSSHDKGAFTGEISAGMLRDLFVSYVLVGHSERRQFFAETDEIVHEKLIQAHRCKMRPILCIGETLAEREAGMEKKVLEKQLKAALAGLTKEDILNTVIAYEPVWAIGTGCTATVEQAQEAHHFIRSVITDLSSKETAAKIRLQYGGSVTPANAKELLQAPDIDGALVGSASLDPRSFAKIIFATSSENNS